MATALGVSKYRSSTNSIALCIAVAASALRQKVLADQIVERKNARAAQDEIEQRAGPQQVVGIILRIDQQLDHQRHAEHGGGPETRGQTERQEDRRRQLDGGRKIRGHIRGQQRHSVFLLEQQQRRVPARELALRRAPEYETHAEAEEQLRDGEGNALEERKRAGGNNGNGARRRGL